VHGGWVKGSAKGLVGAAGSSPTSRQRPHDVHTGRCKA